MTGRLCFVEGDATVPLGSGTKIIAHICNDVGAWDAGFVLAISRRWREPEVGYRAWHAGGGVRLGAVQLVAVDVDLAVANMVAQRGGGGGDGPPIRYVALEECLELVAKHAKERTASVHMPRIGCGLAGGTWDRVEPIIVSALINRGVDVTVYDLLRSGGAA